MNNDTKKILMSALNRLVDNKPIHLKQGAKVNQANVIRETGRSPEQMKLSRFPSVVAAIKEAKALKKIDKKRAEDKALRARRTIQEMLDDSRSQLNKMCSINNAQDNYILELKDEIEFLKNGGSSLASD